MVYSLAVTAAAAAVAAVALVQPVDALRRAAPNSGFRVYATNATKTTDYDPYNLPATSERDQFGYNRCGGADPATSHCQNVFVNSADDFCLWAPHKVDTIGNSEARVISYCTRRGYGTRLIPDGTLTGVHFVRTPDYVQVTGVGDFTKINIPNKDDGGELDPHGADGLGNPHGALVFTNAFDQGSKYRQIHEWTNFMAYNEFCIRACIGANAASLCNHIYDVMGCSWNMPANYEPDVFENCLGKSDKPMGVYKNGKSTWYQGQSPTPSAHSASPSSKCTQYPTISVQNVASSAPTGGPKPTKKKRAFQA